MAKKISSRKPNFANNRSHAENITKKKQKVNMQNVTIDGVKVQMSTREIRSLRKNNTAE